MSENTMDHYGRDTCPVTGRPFGGESWTDHALPGTCNRCKECDPVGYMPIGVRLHKLERERAIVEKRAGK